MKGYKPTISQSNQRPVLILSKMKVGNRKVVHLLKEALKVLDRHWEVLRWRSALTVRLQEEKTHFYKKHGISFCYVWTRNSKVKQNERPGHAGTNRSSEVVVVFLKLRCTLAVIGFVICPRKWSECLNFIKFTDHSMTVLPTIDRKDMLFVI